MSTPRRPRLGISACLLGQPVRWDGGHRRDATCLDLLGPLVEWVAVCPEVELGLPVPRPPIRLMARPGGKAPALLTMPGGEDWTARMAAFAARRVEELSRLALDGYVTKKDSPSCGLSGVPLHPAGGAPPRRVGVGAFVSALRRRLPGLAIEDEARLRDPRVRRRFLAAVRASAAARAGAQGPGGGPRQSGRSR